MVVLQCHGLLFRSVLLSSASCSTNDPRFNLSMPFGGCDPYALQPRRVGCLHYAARSPRPRCSLAEWLHDARRGLLYWIMACMIFHTLRAFFQAALGPSNVVSYRTSCCCRYSTLCHWLSCHVDVEPRIWHAGPSHLTVIHTISVLFCSLPMLVTRKQVASGVPRNHNLQLRSSGVVAEANLNGPVSTLRLHHHSGKPPRGF